MAADAGKGVARIVLAHAAPVRLGPLTITPALRQIVHADGSDEIVEPKVMAVLVALLDAGGAILTRDELCISAWDGRIVGDDAINRVMAGLRRLATGIAAGILRVETVSRVGYRLLVTVPDPSGDAADAPAAADGVAVPPVDAVAAPEPTRPLLAVLAFDNLSDDPEIGYFSDGVAEDILQAVSRAGYIAVAGRASSFQYRGAGKSVATIARDLRASHVLDGSVRRSGSRVRVTASLIDCATLAVLWSDRFDRDIADVFALQDEIAEAIAAALEFPLTAPTTARRIDPAAYDLYLKARSLGGVPADAAQCAALLEQVVAIAPGYAPAWAELAVATIIHTRHYERVRFAARRPAMAAAANRAIALDPATSLAYVALSQIEPLGAYARRERLLEQALAGNARSDALKYAADFAQMVGRNAESFELISQAYAIDPRNRLIANNRAVALADAGFLASAFQAFAAAREIWPDFDWLITAPLSAAALTGDWAEADRLLALPVAWDEPRFVGVCDLVRFVRNATPASIAARLAADDDQVARKGTIGLLSLIVLCAVGAVDAAFALAGRASFAAVFDPDGAPPDNRMLVGVLFGCANSRMRRDVRFVALCGKLGLLDYWHASGRWPDCVAETAPWYDFPAEAARCLADPARGVG